MIIKKVEHHMVLYFEIGLNPYNYIRQYFISTEGSMYFWDTPQNHTIEVMFNDV